MPQRGVTGSVSRRARYNGLEGHCAGLWGWLKSLC